MRTDARTNPTTGALRRAAAAALLVLTLAPAVSAQEDGAGEEPPAPQEQEDAERRARLERRAAELSELAGLVELGLSREALEYGLARVGAGGSLADDGRAVALVARVLFEAGREDEAEALLVAAQVEPATGPWIELEWARIDLARDELDSALSRLVRADGSVRLPSIPAAWSLCGRTLARRGDLTAALPYLRRFVEMSPFDPDTVTAFHLMYLEALGRRDAEGAAALLAESQRRRRAFELIRARSLQVRSSPDDALPRYGLGLAHLELGDARTAARVLGELVERKPDFQRAYFQLGEARRLSGDFAGADAAYGEGLVRDPDDHKCRLNRGLLAAQMGRDEAARADFEHLLGTEAADDPLFASMYLGLARLYTRAGRGEAADQAYARYRELGGSEPLVPR